MSHFEEVHCAARKCGTWVDESGESGGRYAVFSRQAAEQICAGLKEEERSGWAWMLTGWKWWSNGPGLSFGHDPCVRLFKHAVLVYQRTGLDI